MPLMVRFVSVLLTMFLTACGGSEEFIRPQKGKISESVYASGMVRSQGQYEVRATVSGILAEWMVSEGDSIGANEVIARIESAMSDLQRRNAVVNADFNTLSNNREKLDEASQSVSLAREKYRNDSLLFERQKRLWQQSVGSKVEMEARQLQADNSRMVLEQAVLRQEQLRKQLLLAQQQSANALAIADQQTGDFSVRSRMDGRVYALYPQPGEWISPQTTLAVVGASERFYLELQIDEYDIARIALGQQVFITMDSFKDSVFTGTVRKIYPLMNERSRSFTIEADFTRPVQGLYPNLTAEASVLMMEKDEVLLIPRPYLSESGEVTLRSGEKRKVEVGLKDYSMAEIRSGISEQDELILPQP
jgi:HlyD family secretion protein